jgi:hypothetical protein
VLLIKVSLYYIFLLDSFTMEKGNGAPPEMEVRSGSESEYNVYFCQSYPKSKDDILREIMAQKMNSTENNLGQEPLNGPVTTGGQCCVLFVCLFVSSN